MCLKVKTKYECAGAWCNIHVRTDIDARIEKCEHKIPVERGGSGTPEKCTKIFLP